MPFADHGVQLGPQAGIAEHFQVGREDRAVLVAQFFADLIAVMLDFGPGGIHGAGQALELVVDGIPRDEPPGDAKSLLVDDQGFANGDAGRNGDSLKFLHATLLAAGARANACNVALRRATRLHAARLPRRTCGLGGCVCLPRNRQMFARRAKPLGTRHSTAWIVTARAALGAAVSKSGYSSPKPWLTSSARESSACSASTPVPSNRNSVPATAANIRIAKILLPSTRSLSLMTSIVD